MDDIKTATEFDFDRSTATGAIPPPVPEVLSLLRDDVFSELEKVCPAFAAQMREDRNL